LPSEGAHWSYEGAGGLAKWGDLNAANKACSLGSQQSPIDIGPTRRLRSSDSVLDNT
jgi:carbonic anhydrase